MRSPAVRTQALLALVAVATLALAGCGVTDGGNTVTTTPASDARVTIQTETAIPAADTAASTTATTTGTGDRALDGYVATLSSTLGATTDALQGATQGSDAGPLAEAMTARTIAFDRIIDTITGAVATGDAAARLQTAVVTAAPALSTAYRDFVDAARQAADSNDSAGLASAKTRLIDAIELFRSAVAAG